MSHQASGTGGKASRKPCSTCGTRRGPLRKRCQYCGLIVCAACYPQAHVEAEWAKGCSCHGEPLLYEELFSRGVTA